MEIEYRQKSFHLLAKGQQQSKLQKDSEYEIAAQNLSAVFYQKKRSVGVSAKEEIVYQAAKSKLWDDYYQWAVSAGLYEEVTPEQQLTETEEGLNAQLVEVNLIRIELGKPELEIKRR